MGFLDYLDDIESTEEEKPRKKIVKQEKESTKQPKKKSKVLCLNVEVRTPDGARVVIEKLQDWITKQEEGNINGKKKTYRIPPKKVIKNSEKLPPNEKKLVETTSHAMDILEGLPDEPEPNMNPIPNQMGQMPVRHQPNLDTVSGHASALL